MAWKQLGCSFFFPGKPESSSVEEAAQPEPPINTREDIIFLQNPPIHSFRQKK